MQDLAGSRALELVPEQLKSTVENSSILYAPKPFKWMSTAHSTPLGHTIVTEGSEVPLKDLDYEESKLKRYPMIWTNPETGEKCKRPTCTWSYFSIRTRLLTWHIECSLANSWASCLETLSQGRSKCRGKGR